MNFATQLRDYYQKQAEIDLQNFEHGIPPIPRSQEELHAIYVSLPIALRRRWRYSRLRQTNEVKLT
jgi:hypothetical protein